MNIALEPLLLDFKTIDADGDKISLGDALRHTPAVICVGMPHVHASRLVVGYLRRLKDRVSELPIWVVLQGDSSDIERYHTGYLGGLHVLHDHDLRISRRLQVSHVPTTFYIEERDAEIRVHFTGFKRASLNQIATLAAEALGQKPKELVTVMDNKGEYELAEKALSAE